jgi:hypothetical protein
MFLIMLMKKKWLETEVDVFDHVDFLSTNK